MEAVHLVVLCWAINEEQQCSVICILRSLKQPPVGVFKLNFPSINFNCTLENVFTFVSFFSAQFLLLNPTPIIQWHKRQIATIKRHINVALHVWTNFRALVVIAEPSLLHQADYNGVQSKYESVAPDFWRSNTSAKSILLPFTYSHFFPPWVIKSGSLPSGAPPAGGTLPWSPCQARSPSPSRSSSPTLPTWRTRERGVRPTDWSALAPN